MQSKKLHTEALLLLASKVQSATLREKLLSAAARDPGPTPTLSRPQDLLAAVQSLPDTNLTKQRLAAEGWLTPPRPRPTLLAAVVTRSSAEEAVRQALRDEPLTARAVAEDTGLPRASVYYALASLGAAGAVHVTGKGTRGDPYLYSSKVAQGYSSNRPNGLVISSLRDETVGRLDLGRLDELEGEE